MPNHCDLCDTKITSEAYYVHDLFGTYSGHVCPKCLEKHDLQGITMIFDNCPQPGCLNGINSVPDEFGVNGICETCDGKSKCWQNK